MASSQILTERGLIAKARGIYDRVSKSGREPSGEDRAEFDRMLSQADLLMADARSEEARERSEIRRQTAIDFHRPPDRGSVKMFAHPELRARYMKSRECRAIIGYREAFLDWMVSGRPIAERIPAEYRDTVINVDAKGGFLATPVQISDVIVRAVNDLVWIRSKATVITLADGKSLGVPQVSTNLGDANWTTEVAAVTEDTTMALSQRVLEPKLLSKLSKASMRFMSAAADPDVFIANELGYKFGITEEKAFLTGTGTGQPLGVFTADPNGVSTSRDIATGNTATTIGADNVMQMKYNLKQTYRVDPSLAWIWSRDAVRQIMLLKDTANNYLFHASTVSGEPDKLLNIPVAESEYAPNVFTTGLYVGVLGAFRYYHITEYDNLTIQRLTELYSATAEIGFIARRFVDAAPVAAAAFSRSKLA